MYCIVTLGHSHHLRRSGPAYKKRALPHPLHPTPTITSCTSSVHQSRIVAAWSFLWSRHTQTAVQGGCHTPSKHVCPHPSRMSHSQLVPVNPVHELILDRTRSTSTSWSKTCEMCSCRFRLRASTRASTRSPAGRASASARLRVNKHSQPPPVFLNTTPFYFHLASYFLRLLVSCQTARPDGVTQEQTAVSKGKNVTRKNY